MKTELQLCENLMIKGLGSKMNKSEKGQGGLSWTNKFVVYPGIEGLIGGVRHEYS